MEGEERMEGQMESEEDEDGGCMLMIEERGERMQGQRVGMECVWLKPGVGVGYNDSVDWITTWTTQ